MDAPQFTALVGNITLGKKLPDAVYLHKAALSEVEQTLANFIQSIIVDLSRQAYSLSDHPIYMGNA